MAHKCPRCWSFRVQHCTPEVRRYGLLVQYRCSNCEHCFWSVVHRTGLRLSVIAGVAAVATALTWSLHEAAPQAADEPSPVASPGLRQVVSEARAPRLPDRIRGLAMLESAARDGSAPAQYEFGLALRDGNGVAADPERALAFMRLAAGAGVTRAQFELGRTYNDGIGVLRDIGKGFAWLNLAAENGLADAAIERDAVLLAMAPDEVLLARREARRILVTYRNTTDPTRAAPVFASGRWLGEE